MPAKFAKNARRIAHFDVDASEINKVKRVQWSHVGLLGPAIAHLRTRPAQGFDRDWSPWHGHVAELKRRYAMNYDRESS